MTWHREPARSRNQHVPSLRGFTVPVRVGYWFLAAQPHPGRQLQGLPHRQSGPQQQSRFSALAVAPVQVPPVEQEQAHWVWVRVWFMPLLTQSGRRPYTKRALAPFFRGFAEIWLYETPWL